MALEKVLMLTIVASLAHQCLSQGTPILNWHGLTDYYNSTFMQGYLDIMEANTQPGTYIHSIQIGDTWHEDRLHSVLYNVNDMVQEVCDFIASTPELQNGYHGIGWSQGGQFLRGVAQRCPDPPMKNLVTMGSQHQGVFGFPSCLPEPDNFCDNVREGVFPLAYQDVVQNILVPAQYWHDSLHEQEYADGSGYIAEINNQKSVQNPAYKTNLEQLENFVLLKYNQDNTVIPRESSL